MKLQIGQMFNRNGIDLCVLDIIDFNSKKYVLFSAEEEKIEYLFYELIIKGSDYCFELVTEHSLQYSLFELIENKEVKYE